MSCDQSLRALISFVPSIKETSCDLKVQHYYALGDKILCVIKGESTFIFIYLVDISM